MLGFEPQISASNTTILPTRYTKFSSFDVIAEAVSLVVCKIIV